MKVLIADDEYYTRLGLAKRIREWDGQADIREAETGADALRLIERDPPDILLADIRMPEMDGLTLVERVRLQYPAVTSVMISGFAEFAYAKQALAFGVKDYLLKPIDRGEFMSLLERLYEEIGRRKRSNSAALLNRLLYSAAEDANANAGAGDPASLLPEGRPFAVMAVQCAGAATAEDIDGFLGALREAKLPVAVDGYASRLHDNERIVLLYAADPATDLELFNMHMELCLAQLRALFRTMPESFSAGVSRTRIGGSIKEAYGEAKLALNCRLLSGLNRTNSYEKEAQRGRYNIEGAEEIAGALFHKLTALRCEEAKQIVANVFERLKRDKERLTVQSLQDTYCRFVLILNSSIEYLRGKHPECVCEYFEQCDISGFTSFDELPLSLHRSIDAIRERFPPDPANESVVEEIKRFIAGHYYEDILLDDIARKQYYVDPSYLSRLFKHETGVKFSEYLLSVRMQRAKELLETCPQLSISDVANAVGYNDSSYFVQLFKKYYGQTPGKFRQAQM
ncbi:response regulator transcription factor [Paenibacillus sp.]|uniref:response regulator transcription factor n=1 Tax=Paenibacillus sp. TaxID=58172 RepID=UPI002D237D1A|nr:response regulator [Paenibacillus sp.]HZG86424.1 response regulator [Paenibacillus sp.]